MLIRTHFMWMWHQNYQIDYLFEWGLLRPHTFRTTNGVLSGIGSALEDYIKSQSEVE